MASSSSITRKSVSDIIEWYINHSEESVKLFLYRRKTDGGKYFSYGSPYNDGFKHLVVSWEEINFIFEAISIWAIEKFTVNNVLSEGNAFITVTRVEVDDPKRLILVFSQCDNNDLVDLRNQWRSASVEISRSSP